MTLRLVPVTFVDACRFVEAWHRHNPPPNTAIFSVGVADDADRLVGVAIVGRPAARHFDNGQTLEIRRTCTDGTHNANSLLYGAAWRAAKALGYTRLITYTQADESGATLRAVGWRIVAERPPRRGWDCPSRPRDNTSYLSTTRYLWEAG